METENNKLIAEFMELKPKQDCHDHSLYSYNDMPFYSIREKSYDKVMDGICGYVKYHSSWDWLMPCIGKISNQCEEPEELDDLKYALLCNDINTAYDFVVDYLKQ